MQLSILSVNEHSLFSLFAPHFCLHSSYIRQRICPGESLEFLLGSQELRLMLSLPRRPWEPNNNLGGGDINKRYLIISPSHGYLIFPWLLATGVRLPNTFFKKKH